MNRLSSVRAGVSNRLHHHVLEPLVSRLFFDFGVSVAAVVAATLFHRVWNPRASAASLLSLALPAVFLAAGGLIGVYTRLRGRRTSEKAAGLVLAIGTSALTLNALGADPFSTALWALLTLPPVILGRVLVAVALSDRPFVTRVARAEHGPILLIGGAGYIGSLTVELLLARGYRVRVLDRLMYGLDSLRDFIGRDDFELIEGDATDVSRLTAAAHNASAIIHLAGLVGDPACAIDPEFTRHQNIVATRMARDVAQGLGVPRFIFASSCSVYGASDREVREGEPLNPVSLYAQTKIDSERELLGESHQDFAVTILRLATVFGYSRRPRFDLVANLFTAQAVTDGHITVVGPEQWRPFVHVRDVARALVMVLEADRRVVMGQIFNVGDDRLNLTIGQLGELVRQTLSSGRDVHVDTRHAPEDLRNYHVSFEKIRSALGFRAVVGLEQGIAEMADHLRNGAHSDFRDPIFSNYAMTRQASQAFHEPSSQQERLYAPLSLASTAPSRTDHTHPYRPLSPAAGPSMAQRVTAAAES